MHLGYQSYINTSFLHQFNSFLSYKSNGMNHLSDLVLINCHRILPPDIHLLLGSCSNLTFLHIDGLDLNTERAVSSIINRCCPRLKKMHGVFLKDIRIEKPRTHKRNRGNDVDDLSLVGVPLQRMCLKHVHVSVESIKYQYLTKFIFVCPPIISNDDILTLIKTSSSLVEFYIEGSMITNSILSQLRLVDSQLLTIVGLKCLRDTRLKRVRVQLHCDI
ncbi:hypothetical protein BC833DRAFT_390715 [Globomyces pollinis-pini]|nr:hypothetical protein BC833DRAFT_390715 [Globomyces pollinis-pini]